MKSALFILSLLTVVLTMPAEGALPEGLRAQSLLSITTNRDSSLTMLDALIDKRDQFVGLYSKVLASDYDEVFWLKDMEREIGVTLFESDGHKVIQIRSALDRAKQEGVVVANYLRNALLGTYSSCKFMLRRSGSDHWYVQNLETGETVTEVEVQAKLLGVRKIKGLCD